MSWSDLSEWWLSEVASDPAYEAVVTPLLLQMLAPEPDSLYLDVGCGEGRVARTVTESGARVHGLDIGADLVAKVGAGFVGDMVYMPVSDDSYHGVYSVLSLEHVVDVTAFFSEAARVCRTGGVLAVVMNHPVWTAPNATPITDQFGEVLWRPGEYFSPGTEEMPAGESTVVFYHRSMADLLNAASEAGWSLEHMVEQPHHEYEDQAGIPRLMGCRWRLLGRPVEILP